MSPTVFKEHGYRFFFYSREEKRAHIHVEYNGKEAKFWITPKIEIATNHGYTIKHLNEIYSLIEGHHEEIKRSWENHFTN